MRDTQAMQDHPTSAFGTVRRAFKVFVLFAHQWFWIGVCFVEPSAGLVIAGIVLGFMMVLGVELGHHRYFAHRAFKTGRLFQFILAVWATAAFQRDIFWWASMHRRHHRYSDTPEDPHTPHFRGKWGFVYAYLYWGVARKNAHAKLEYVPDLMKFPELRILVNVHYLVNLGWGLGAFAVAHWLPSVSGWQTLAWLYVVPHFICQHIISAEATFAHGMPQLPACYRNFNTGDKSLNNLLLGLLSLGGGFHNNHHEFPASARIGLKWYEVDITFLVIKALNAAGIIHGVRVPERAVRYMSLQNDGGANH